VKAVFVSLVAGFTTVAAIPASAQTIAVLQGLDKTTARISTLEAPIDQTVRFGRLAITVKACVKRPPEETPLTAAFLEIDEFRPGADRNVADPNVKATATVALPKRVFSGWMFAQSPAISALEDPIYDVNVLDCRAAETAAPSSGPKGK
jgi:hypothetical protein